MPRDIDAIVEEAVRGTPVEPAAPVNPFDRSKSPAQWRLWERRNSDRIQREKDNQSTDSSQ